MQARRIFLPLALAAIASCAVIDTAALAQAQKGPRRVAPDAKQEPARPARPQRQDRAQRLDALFLALKQAPNAQAAQAIEEFLAGGDAAAEQGESA